MASDNLTTTAMFIQRVFSTASGALLAIIIVWTVATVSEVKERVAVIDSREYPPRFVIDKLGFLNDEQRRCQRQIDRLETNHPGINSESLPPYSSQFNATEDFGYDSACFEVAECRDSADCVSCECVAGSCSGDAHGDA